MSTSVLARTPTVSRLLTTRIRTLTAPPARARAERRTLHDQDTDV